jgi:hypothetical protein
LSHVFALFRELVPIYSPLNYHTSSLISVTIQFNLTRQEINTHLYRSISSFCAYFTSFVTHVLPCQNIWSLWLLESHIQFQKLFHVVLYQHSLKYSNSIDPSLASTFIFCLSIHSFCFDRWKELWGERYCVSAL